MELFLLNSSLDATHVIDKYISAIWTDRYNKCGDFELFTAVSPDLVANVKKGTYLQNLDSEHVMIVESISTKTNPEEGNRLTITGRSLESILDRRIVWGQKTLSGDFQNGIKTLLNENIISPLNTNRKISNFIFEESTDSKIKSLKIDAQYTGDNLYDVICSLCEERDIGFKVTLNDNKQFVFKLYTGLDRSYDQTDNPYVIFSPGYENLLDANYLESTTSLKNVTLVGGEGEGASRRYTAVGDVSGLDRRELFTDARDISSDVGDGKKLTNDEYVALLRQRGQEKLAENIEVSSFEGEADTSVMFKYGEDFFMGDVVQIEDEYGHEGTARVTEIVTSSDESGTSTYPAFQTIEKKGD